MRPRIDSHQHFWTYRAADYAWISEAMPLLRRDCLPPDVTASMAVAQVDRVVAVQARCALQETDALLALAAQHRAIVGVVGWLDLCQPALAAQLENWQGQAALKGFRHLLQDEVDVPAWLDNTHVNAGLKLLQARQFSYDILVHQHQLPWIQTMCRQHDQHWLVLDHLGKPALANYHSDPRCMNAWCAALAPLAAMPHVVVKLSGLVTQTAWAGRSCLDAADGALIQRCFDIALDYFGPQRLLFGSDWPVCQLAAPYDRVVGLVEEWAGSRLSLAEQADFWAGNATRVYSLNP